MVQNQVFLGDKVPNVIRKKFRGIDIYKAVLCGGVRDRAQFIKWIANILLLRWKCGSRLFSNKKRR